MKIFSNNMKSILLLKQNYSSFCNLLNITERKYSSSLLVKRFINIEKEHYNSCLKSKRKDINIRNFLATKVLTEKDKLRNDDTTDDKTHFGNETVSKEEKAQRVHGVFENVAAKYDLMNDVMSGGIHRVWKDMFVARLNPTVGVKLLDVAGGTGDITFRILNHINNQLKSNNHVYEDKDLSSSVTGFKEEVFKSHSHQQESKITVCDISESMLKVGEQRAAKAGYRNVDWVCGDAQKLPFPEGSFDAYTIAYGMRNVVDVDKALHEAYRVLKPGGRFMCLEFSQVTNSLVRSVYDLYSFQLIPVMGQVIAADWDSYQYLVESIRKFPDQETYKTMIENAGFRKVTYENLTFGVTAIHSGFKI